MVRFEVKEKVGPDVKCKCIDPGLLLPRANLTFWREGRLVRERNAMLPTISSKVSTIFKQCSQVFARILMAFGVTEKLTVCFEVLIV